MTAEIATQAADRLHLVQRAKLLNRFTIGWNAIEGIVALAAGVAASSVGLIAFGLDSGIEVSAALVLAWRLHQERHRGCQQANEHLARRLVALSFAALAVYVGVSASLDLIYGNEPEAAPAGMAIAAISLVVMPVLAVAKRRVALDLGSQAAVAEAAQTNVCTLLSAALLVGLLANAVLGWWWADPVAGLAIAAVAARMAIATFGADSLGHACCS